MQTIDMTVCMLPFTHTLTRHLYVMFFTCSGEGTLTAFNIRRKRMDLQSELFDSEFLSIAAVKVIAYRKTHRRNVASSGNYYCISFFLLTSLSLSFSHIHLTSLACSFFQLIKKNFNQKSLVKN